MAASWGMDMEEYKLIDTIGVEDGRLWRGEVQRNHTLHWERRGFL